MEEDTGTEQLMLTTSDNPYNPFTEWEKWYNFDTTRGYCTSAYLARVTKLSDEMSELEENLELQRAMKEIFRLNLTGNYVLVSEDSVEEFLKRNKK